MAAPFASRDHHQISTLGCFCGVTFPSLLLLDTHLYGREVADQMMRDRVAALTAMQTVVPDTLTSTERMLFGSSPAMREIGGGR